ncbi:MAG: aminopeptidase [Anaerolineaceae bacterium]|nr:aminopeptidase [Anaerolineaceae bacterium]
MMPDPRNLKHAKLLVDYCVEVQQGEWVVIHCQPVAEPLINAVVSAVLQAGGFPTVMMELPFYKEILLRSGTEEQIRWYSPVDEFIVNNCAVSIYIDSSVNVNMLKSVTPEKMQMRSEPDGKWFDSFSKRSTSGDLRWVYSIYPCAAFAQQAEMSLNQYEDFVYSAMGVDQDDPVAHWCHLKNYQQKLIDWLVGKKEVVIKGKHVDLTLSIEDRIFINSDGKENMPSGEIFTGPVEDSANGWIRFNYPAVFNGQTVENVFMRFLNGKIIEAKADKGQNYLETILDTDEGSRYLGEFAFGTNNGIRQFTGNILFDEKIGGSIHVAIGAGYPKTGSVNQSSVHWDFICDSREDTSVWIDGNLFYKDGVFVVGI